MTRVKQTACRKNVTPSVSPSSTDPAVMPSPSSSSSFSPEYDTPYTRLHEAAPSPRMEISEDNNDDQPLDFSAKRTKTESYSSEGFFRQVQASAAYNDHQYQLKREETAPLVNNGSPEYGLGSDGHSDRSSSHSQSSPVNETNGYSPMNQPPSFNPAFLAANSAAPFSASALNFIQAAIQQQQQQRIAAVMASPAMASPAGSPPPSIYNPLLLAAAAASLSGDNNPAPAAVGSAAAAAAAAAASANCLEEFNKVSAESQQKYADFRDSLIPHIDESRSCRRQSGRQNSPTSNSGVIKDEAYWERRRKNNEAAKRSRDARRTKENEIAVRAQFLEQENVQLKLDLAQVRADVMKLRDEVNKREGKGKKNENNKKTE